MLLAKWRDGEASAFEELMPLVYSHLREVAASYIRRERNPDVLQATVLVHELYLRLLNQRKAEWSNTYASSQKNQYLPSKVRASR